MMDVAAAEVHFDLESCITHAKKALELNADWDEAKAILQKAEKKLNQKSG